MVGGQNKAVVTSVAKLYGHGVLGTRILECVVNTVATNLVDGVANRTASEGSAVDSLDSSNGALGQACVRGRVWNGAVAGVAVRVHPELGVRVDVHVQLNTLACSEAVELSLQRLGLNTVASGGTFVVLVTRGCAGTLSLSPRLVCPVPVDIATDAACRWSALPVLAPQAVAVLGEVEAVRVDDREDVEVVLVLERGGCGIGGCQKLVCSVFVDHGGDPFTSVHSTVPNDSLLGSLASAAPDVDSLDVASLHRFAGRDHFSVRGISSSEIGDPLVVVS